MALGRELQDVRERHGWTREDVGKKMVQLGEKGVAPRSLATVFLRYVEERDGLKQFLLVGPEEQRESREARVTRYFSALGFSERDLAALGDYKFLEKFLENYRK